MLETVKVIIKSDKNRIPFYATSGACGADCMAKLEKSVYINSLERVMIPTGLYFEIPEGYEIQIRPRSGLALKYGITVLNTPGTIDSDYRGEVSIILMNHSKDIFEVKDGMRIAQIVLAKAFQADFVLEEKLSFSQRGELGFGHTGV